MKPDPGFFLVGLWECDTGPHTVVGERVVPGSGHQEQCWCGGKLSHVKDAQMRLEGNLTPSKELTGGFRRTLSGVPHE